MIHDKNINSGVVIKIQKNFAIEEAGIFREEMLKNIEKGSHNFTLDFSNCIFIDSTGLGVLVAIYKKCAELQGSFKMINLNENVLKVFKLTRLDKVFEIVH